MLRQLFEGNNLGFRDSVKARLDEIMEEKLVEFKKLISARYYSEETEDFPKKKSTEGTDDQDDGDGSDTSEQLEVLKQGDEPKKKELDEANVTRQGRLKVIKVRIRNGKVQRRKKVSGVKGYTLRAGRLKRITPGEHRRRKLGARRGKFKRKAKLSRIRTKMRRSLRRRHSMGL